MKGIWFVVLSFFSIGEILAQVRYGVKAGVNVNTINSYIKDAPSWVDFEDNAESTVGFHAGVFFVMDLGEKFSFRPEIEYIQKGKGESYPDDLSQKVKVNYIQLPLLFSCKIINTLYVEAGPGLGYLLSSKSDNDIFTFPAESYTVKLEVTAISGFRYTVFKKFDVIARYNFGLTNIQDSMYYAQNPDTSEIIGFESVAKNRVLSFSIAYSFK